MFQGKLAEVHNTGAKFSHRYERHSTKVSLRRDGSLVAEGLNPSLPNGRR